MGQWELLRELAIQQKTGNKEYIALKTLKKKLDLEMTNLCRQTTSLHKSGFIDIKTKHGKGFYNRKTTFKCIKIKNKYVNKVLEAFKWDQTTQK